MIMKSSMANITTPTIETNVHEDDLYDVEDTTQDEPISTAEIIREYNELKEINHRLVKQLSTAYDFIQDFMRAR